eukprot:TRINITY_DN8626_c0_g1_i1.p1 TRINITY_DN8626_c0_g1~~TRINITY_DN8626_c0_g1_i1.p1  ORF type:complete len:1027 (+),score=185.24 TRINITY_DN8626_c0_g1_i1:79-3159(+)
MAFHSFCVSFVLASLASRSLVEASRFLGTARSLSTASATNASTGVVAASTARATVRLPITDKREFDYFTLANGLRVLAVHDPEAKKAGFAVAVSAGSFLDPPELPGLAHFCEHLLFLGTEKYTDEASFDEFLSKHDGSNNAFTAQEKTVYFNEVSDAGLDEGLDRFAQFFISPLFKAEMVGRELDAVNSEHGKNIPNQGRRLWEVMRSVARPGSVVGRFYTGTTESLGHGNATTIAALKKYHEENYCAPRMTLVVVSSRDVKKQAELVRKHFDAVPRGEGVCSPLQPEFATDKPFSTEASTGRRLELYTDAMPQLWMMFPMRPTLRDYKAQPASMLQYLLAYGGPKSLKSRLKAEGLVSNLGLQVDQTTAATLVFLTFDLTHAGAGDPDATSAVVFDYLAEVRRNSRTLVESIYPSMQQMARVTFDYQEAPSSVMDTVSGLAASLLSYNTADVLAGDFTIDRPDVSLLDDLLGALIPEKVTLAVATHGFKRDALQSSTALRRNKYYDVTFSDEPIAASLLERWGGPRADSRRNSSVRSFRLPPPLECVPSKLDVINATAGDVPRQLEAQHGAQVWWLGRGAFLLPKAQLRVKLTVPDQLFASANFVAMRRLHVELLKRVLEEPMEDVGNCGLDWDISEISDGYHVSMSGYDEHLATLVQQLAGGFALTEFDAKMFAQSRQNLLDDLEDTSSMMPYQHALQTLAAVSSNGMFGRTSVISALQSVDKPAALIDYLAQLRSSGLRVQVLATGNVDEAATKKLASRFTSELGLKRTLRADEAAAVRVFDATEPIEVRMNNPIAKDPNSATVNVYQYGVPDVAERVKVLMLGKMISTPVYETLRTKEQLGYVVFGGVAAQQSILQLQLVVQGSKASPDNVDLRMESVLDTFQQALSNLSTAEFHSWKAALRSALHEDDQNMAEEADRFWEQIATGDECFDRKKLARQYLDTFNASAELAVEFDRFRRHPRKISVRLFGTGVAMTSADTSVAIDGKGTALVLGSDSIEDENLAAAQRHFWPAAGVCKVYGKV